MRLAGLFLRLGTNDVFRLRQRKQVTQLGRVEEIVRAQVDVAARLQIVHSHRPNTIPVDVSSDKLMPSQQDDTSTADIRGQQVGQHGKRDAWFMAKPRDSPIAGIQFFDRDVWHRRTRSRDARREVLPVK